MFVKSQIRCYYKGCEIGGEEMYHFIVNPNSRSGAGKSFWADISAVLERKHIPYKAYMTRYPGHATKLAAQITAKASRKDPVTLVAMGGDGTIHEVFSGIRDLDCVVFGFIPTGSGNDFCRGMRIPTDSIEALYNILRCKVPVRLDVPYVIAGGRKLRFGISTGIGYDAAVCHEVASSPMKDALNRIGLGKLVYLVVALKQMLFVTPTPAVIRLDSGRRYYFSHLYFAAVMNQKYEGGGFKFCPSARTDDHVLDLIAVEGMSRLRMLLTFPTALWGGHTKAPGVHIMRCTKAEILTASGTAVHVDGDPCGVCKKLTAGLEKKTLSVLI